MLFLDKCCVAETRAATISNGQFQLNVAQFSAAFPSIGGARSTSMRYYFNSAIAGTIVYF